MLLSAIKNKTKYWPVCRPKFLFFRTGILSIALACLLSPQAFSQGQYSDRGDSRQKNISRLTQLGTDYLIDGEHQRAYATLTAAQGEGSARAAWTLATA